ncbi:MAG: PqiA/YebS family transporter subunit [Pseudomonadota bacterium]
MVNNKTPAINRAVCPDCDWLVDVPIAASKPIHCPRCGHRLAGGKAVTANSILALAVTALVLELVSLWLPFVGYSANGITQSMSLLDTSRELLHFHERLLAILVLFTIAVIPLLYLLAVIWVFLRQSVVGAKPPGPVTLYLIRTLVQLRVWMMADVFLLGALVSLIKISGLASVTLDTGFYSFIAFVIMLLVVADKVSRYQLWHLLPHQQAPSAKTGQTANSQGLIGCVCCHAPNPKPADRCWRCGESLMLSRWRGSKLTIALLIAAALMLLPAHLLPVMETTNLGRTHPSTIIAGVLDLWRSGDVPIAIIVFVASLVIPVAKILVLLVLLWVSSGTDKRQLKQRLWLYKITDWIGRWSMIDIFVVAVLVALVRSGQLMSVYPGNAALAFALTVILTMLAAMTFDTRRFFKDKESL